MELIRSTRIFEALNTEREGIQRQYVLSYYHSYLIPFQSIELLNMRIIK